MTLLQEASRKISESRRSIGEPVRKPSKERPKRVIAARRGLPSGRAVIGGFLVASAALGAYLSSTAGHGLPTGRFVVAQRDLAPGDVIARADIAVVAIDLPEDQARFTARTLSQLEGAVLRGPIGKGGFVTAAAVQTGPADVELRSEPYRELSFALPAGRALTGTLRPGDRVDVLATTEGGTYTLAQHIQVLAATGSGGGSIGNAQVTITLALPDKNSVLAVTHGAAAEKLTLVRSTRSTDSLPSAYQLPRLTASAVGATAGSPTTTVAAATPRG